MKKRLIRWISSLAVCAFAGAAVWYGKIGDLWGAILIVFAVSTALGMELEQIGPSGVDLDGGQDGE